MDLRDLFNLEFNKSDWQLATEAAVKGILGDLAPRFYSLGTSFYNVDAWTQRFFVSLLVKHIEKNKTLTESDIISMVDESNKDFAKFDPKERKIVVANIKSKNFTKDLGLALSGGGYHEAAHTLYTRRKTITAEEVVAPLMKRWNEAQAAGFSWARQAQNILKFQNLVEDIRIEQLLTKQYPPTKAKLECLCDFILNLEYNESYKAYLHAKDQAQNGTSSKKNKGHEDVQSHNNGSKNLSNAIDVDSWLFQGLAPDPEFKSTPAHVAVGLIRDYGKNYKIERQDLAYTWYKESQPEIYALIESQILPLIDEVQMLTPKQDMEALWYALDILLRLHQIANELQVPELAPQRERRVFINKGNSQNPNGDGDGDGDGPEDGDIVLEFTDDETKAAKDILDDLEANGIPIKDIQDAIQQAAKEQMNKDAKQAKESQRSNEKSYGAANGSGDTLKEAEKDKENAKRMYDDILGQCGMVRAGLNGRIRALLQTNVYEGTEYGYDLSEEFLVDTYMDLKHGIAPRRAFKEKDEILDTSIAVVVALDLSGSMGSWMNDATKVAMAIVEPFTLIGGNVAAFGFTTGNDGESISGQSDYNPELHHRDCDPVLFVHIKDFSENFHNCLPKFGKLEATGGTPTADAVQLAWEAIKTRPEKNKFVFIVTDGMPACGHAEVINKQQREMSGEGIHLVGVGLGDCSKGILDIFEDGLVEDDITTLPPILINKVMDLVVKNIFKR